MKRIINIVIDLFILLACVIVPFVIFRINKIELVFFNVIWICFYLSLIFSIMFNLTTLFYLSYFKKLNKKEILIISTLFVSLLPFINCLFTFFDKGYMFILVVIVNFVFVILHILVFIYLKSKNNSLLLKECNNNKC